ncbi:conserved hypothetical protein [Talaromyces stipitatus ATCC 10500]|uniref:Centromere protein Cenp-O n=1 Tax=Talaromyces stipitatus (strain ATCC 10500 / CBS 375.48 / QM 6759 / NRRL 1006) TaxID=441959 RepID=B8MMG3_TALSN|nr:uncharacterized protein TSTA_099670 [Talaromyces stipitatus ATCC 10500]EED13717.1 conserved hypothetical protein [Talaromyces stipitatus ATCC 10500]
MDNETIANIDSSLESLDSEISKIRKTIKNFQDTRRLLSASLLSSHYVRQEIEQNTRTGSGTTTRFALKEVATLMSDALKHRDTNYHRLAFSTTLFPWKDPNPYSESPNLLGLRIDVCVRNGTFAKPYYVLLQRQKESGNALSSTLQREKRSSMSLSIYRHTIPPFIPMDKLAHRYLPQSRLSRRQGEDADEVEGLKSKAKTRKQDINAFARHLRKELAAWYARRDSISWLQERFGVTDVSHGTDGNSGLTEDDRHRTTQAGGLVSLAATSLEARYVRIEWKDGRVGRFKLSNSGLVERAVVIGERGRDKQTELVLMGGDKRVESLVTRLLTV